MYLYPHVTSNICYRNVPLSLLVFLSFLLISVFVAVVVVVQIPLNLFIAQLPFWIQDMTPLGTEHHATFFFNTL